MAGKRFKRVQRFVVGDRHIVSATGAVQKRVLRPNGREVQPGGNGVRLFDLAVGGLHHRRLHTEVDPNAAMLQRRAVLAALDTVSGGLHADQADVGFLDKISEHADGV